MTPSNQPLTCQPREDICSVCVWAWQDHDKPLTCRLYPEKKIEPPWLPFWARWDKAERDRKERERKEAEKEKEADHIVDLNKKVKEG